VHTSETSEAYDILATDPLNGKQVKIQVKKINQRDDRRGDLVVYARKGNGTTYDYSEADFLVGVWAVDGETPRVYMFENRLLTEYWARDADASNRWIELPIALNRGALNVGA